MIKYSSQPADAGPEVKSDRLFYLDWLRVFAIIIVFTYHSDIFFDLRNYFLQDTVRSLASTIHREFCQLWMMPLFFMISGASVLYSLKSRKAWKFIKDRFLRLFVPLMTIGILLIASIQVYLFRSFNGNFSGTFLSWYPQYFNGLYPYQPSGNFAINGMHL
jgi:glucans biosynthesis protein C